MYICGIVLSMNLNLKMTVERSKRCSYFLSLVFITKNSTLNWLRKKKGLKIGSGWPPYSPTLPDPFLNFTQCYFPMAFIFLQVCAIHTFACNHFANFKSEKLFTHAILSNWCRQCHGFVTQPSMIHARVQTTKSLFFRWMGARHFRHSLNWLEIINCLSMVMTQSSKAKGNLYR